MADDGELGRAPRARGVPGGEGLRDQHLPRPRPQDDADRGRRRDPGAARCSRTASAMPRRTAEGSRTTSGSRSRQDFERIRDYFADEFHRDGAHGVAVFSAGMDNVWRPRALHRVGARPRPGRPGVLPRAARSARRPRRGRARRLRRPRARGAVPAPLGTVGGDRGPHRRRSRPPRPGRLVAGPIPAPHREARRGAPERGGRASSTGGCAAVRPPKVIVVSSEETRGEFEELRLDETRSAVVGWTSADAHAWPTELLDVDEPDPRRRARRRRTRCSSAGARRPGADGRAASGWAETLEAASDARVEVLLYEEGADHEAWQCAACGRLRHGGQCPLDGTEIDRRDDGLDLALHQTVAHGGRCGRTAHEDLDPVGDRRALEILSRYGLARTHDSRRAPRSRGARARAPRSRISIDQTLAQDATGTMAMMQFELFGHDRVEVETAVVYVDHNILQIDFKNPDDHRFLQAMSAKYGAWFSRPGNGICHYIHCERFATPGKTLVGADSHTTQSGSAGMIAIGAGGLDVAVCMAGHPFELPCPKIVGVFLRTSSAPVDPGEGRHPRAASATRCARRARGDLRVHRARCLDAQLHRARNDREHDRGARRDRCGLPGGRRDEVLARRAGAPRRLHRARDGRRRGRLRRGRAHRPRSARPARREAVEPRATSSRSTSSSGRRSRRSAASVPRSTRPTRTWRWWDRRCAGAASPRS